MRDTAANPSGSEALRFALAELLGTCFLALAALAVPAPLMPIAVALTLLEDDPADAPKPRAAAAK
ncbi:MAG: hypothetical protein M3Y12_09410 [Bacteroidota bacterium]|nr:hypothetical protein [Bacteroidota bacterium]